MCVHTYIRVYTYMYVHVEAHIKIFSQGDVITGAQEIFIRTCKVFLSNANLARV